MAPGDYIKYYFPTITYYYGKTINIIYFYIEVTLLTNVYLNLSR